MDDSASYLECQDDQCWQQLFQTLICFHNRNSTPSHRRLNRKYFRVYSVFYGLQSFICVHGFDWRRFVIGFYSSINNEKENLSREGNFTLESTSPHMFILDRFPKRSTNGAKYTTMETKALLIGMFGFSSKSCSNKQVSDSGENARI